ncbi:MAG: hypothetical protein JWO03_2485 [Bacteroidetes bacterium]|nr:hypothetical protein [Bacteroidota bacterium]
MKNYKLGLPDLGFSVLLWALLIAKYGYTYGSSDHEELLVYVLFLKNCALYTHDFFVQSLSGSTPNERTVMTHILLPFAGHLGVSIFLFHFFNTILMMLAFISIAGRFISNRYVSWMAVFIAAFVLYNRALGGVDTYSAAFQAGDLSAMIVAWGFVFFLDGKYLWTSVIVAIATFIHVLVGFDIMVVFCAVMLWKYFIDKEINLTRLLGFFAIYLCTAGIYLVLVYRAKASGDGTISDPELFNIMFAFRHPHHFIFRTFPFYTKVLFVIYATGALLFFRKYSYTAFQFVAVTIVVLIVYIIGTDYGHWVFLASFQWYKNTPWVKLLGVIGIVAFVYQYAQSFLNGENRIVNSVFTGGGIIAGAIVFYFYFHGDIAHGYKQYNEDEINLSVRIKDITTPEAVFVQPFGMTALKFYAQRSSYIDFKAIAKNKKDTEGWYQRIQEVYGLNYNMPEKGFQLEQKADEYFNAMTEAQLDRLKSEGVTHMIARTERYHERHKLILAENGYFVYQL